MKNCWRVFPMIVIFCSTLLGQGNSATPAVSTVFALLSGTIDSKTATAGQDITLVTQSDVEVDGKLVIPKGSKLVGHISEVKVKSKDVPQSSLSLVVDKAVKNDGSETKLQAIIAAVAAPTDRSLSSDPVSEMMHSNEPKMVGTSPVSTSTSGDLSSSSNAGSGAAVATASIKRRADTTSILDQNSQGAIGFEGLTLSWQLNDPPPATIFTLAKGKDIKLFAGTQMLLRMAPPR